MFGLGMIKTRPPQPKRWHLIFFVLLILVALAFKMYSYYWPKAEVFVGGKTLHVLVADTPANRYKGWSGKKNMGKYGGMLFVFGETGDHVMVMRDMNFPLDIIWLRNFKIVDIAPNLPPEKGVSENSLTRYGARAPSDMVLELPAGFASQNNLKIGDMVKVIKN